MKKNWIYIVAAIFLVQLAACGAKKSSPNKSTRGRGGYTSGYTTGGGYNTGGGYTGGTGSSLDSAPHSDISGTQNNMLSYIRQFFDGDVGSIYGGTVGMQLQFVNGNLQNAQMATYIWDSYAYEGSQPPIYAYYGSGVSGMSVSGRMYNSHIDVRFEDSYGTVGISGDISGGTFNGVITYGGNNLLGYFSLPTQGVIF